MQPSNRAYTLSFSVFQNTSHGEKTYYRSSYIFKATLIILKWKQPFEADSSWWQILFLISYFFNYFFTTATVSEEVFLQSKWLFRTRTFLKQVLLAKRCIFSRRTLLGAGISWKQSLFLIIFRNLCLKGLSINQYPSF